MAEEDSGERSEDPTPQRREEFRNQGQIAMTRELGTAAILFGSAVIFWFMGRFFMSQVLHLCHDLLGHFAVSAGKEGFFLPAVKFAAVKALSIVGPILGILGTLAFFSTVVQIGFLSNSDALAPDIERISPMNGLKKLFSLRSVVEGFKAFIKVSIVALLSYLIVKSDMLQTPHLANATVETVMSFLGHSVMKLLFGIGLFMILLALLDYGYQWWDLEKRMRMTKQELKEEIKSREGNPHVKARIRKIQRDLAQKRMMEQVPKADVIITNPTHIAVALKYDAALPAPQLIAKGGDLIAEKIKSIAREKNIPIVENKPLARTIFKTLKIGQVIPRELFHAVAEILAYVYKLRKKVMGQDG